MHQKEVECQSTTQSPVHIHHLSQITIPSMKTNVKKILKILSV